METKHEKMYALIEEWKSSGICQEEFCREHGIKIGTFGYWRTKYLKQQEPATPSFIPVQPSEPDGAVEITYPNGVKIRLMEYTAESLATLIRLV